MVSTQHEMLHQEGFLYFCVNFWAICQKAGFWFAPHTKQRRARPGTRSYSFNFLQSVGRCIHLIRWLHLPTLHHPYWPFSPAALVPATPIPPCFVLVLPFIRFTYDLFCICGTFVHCICCFQSNHCYKYKNPTNQQQSFLHWFYALSLFPHILIKSIAFNIWFSNLCVAYMFLIPTHLTFYVSYQNILLHYVMSSMISMHTCCCTCIIGVLSFVPNVKTSALYTLSRNLFCYVIRMSTLIFFYIIIKIFIKCFFYFSILLFVPAQILSFSCAWTGKSIPIPKQIVKIITIHLRFIIVISPLLISGMSNPNLLSGYDSSSNAFRIPGNLHRYN